MRLIDADARVTVQSFDEEHEEYCHNKMTVKQALDFATDERCPPTIDAIPVEWIKQVKSKGFDYMHCAGVILGLWKKQQEAANATDRP